MGSASVCDGRCHSARGNRCTCWCAGLFHGGPGAAAREAFSRVWGEDIPPRGEPRQLELGGTGRWQEAMRAAAIAGAGN
jgi:hypothetical protein